MLKVVSARVPHTAAVLMERQLPRDRTFRNILLSSSEASPFIELCAYSMIAVLGISDILERTRIPGSLPLTKMDPDPTPDPTPFFTNFKDGKKNFLFFSYHLPAGTLSSALKNLNIC
jgi:hypothetical protein